MAYTYSLTAPTPSWVSINPTTGTLSLNAAAQPPTGFAGTIRIRVTDGTHEAFHVVPHNLQPAYTVTPDYRDQTTIEWFVPLSSNAVVAGILPPIVGDWIVPLSSNTEVASQPQASNPAIHESSIPLGAEAEVAPNTGGGGGGGS